MTLGKKSLFSLLLALDLLANILELTHVNFLGISTLISFGTCIFLPGFLILLIFRISKISFWENLLLIVGLSIAFLEFGGLLLNILLPIFGVNDPLAFQNLVIGFDIYLLFLFIFALIRTEHLVVQIQLPRRSSIEKVLYALPMFFPILAALGAIVINNGGSNILTLFLLGFIAFYSLLLVLLRDKIAVDLFPYAIFFIGIACLFTTSLRSWYITGHDIEREYYVFRLTNMHHIWNIAIYRDAYNACLSITILPTILANLLSIQDTYVYKVIFQILFATSPVLVFFIVRNYTTPVLAFLSAFFFVSFPTFFNDMPMLNRQEIGYIFFGLVLYMMLMNNHVLMNKISCAHCQTILPSHANFCGFCGAKLEKGIKSAWLSRWRSKKSAKIESSLSMRRILFIIFALCVVVSHYSTNLVLIVLITFVYVVTLIISLPFVRKIFAPLLSKSHILLKSTFTNNVFLSLPLILILLLTTYIWNNLYTQTSNHVGSVILEVISSIFVGSNADDQSGDLSYSIFFTHQPDPKKELQDYIQSLIKAAEANHSQFYDKSITSKYPVYPLPQEQLAPTRLGIWLSSFHVPVFDIQAELRSLSADFMQIFVFVGLLCILFFKQKKLFDLQYLLLCFGAVFLLILITVLPAISLEYGVLRMFQQSLFILSLPIVIGLSSILFFVKEQKRTLFTGMIAIMFFLILTGFISHLTGDYYPQMTLDNAGLYYDSYYVQKADVIAMTWLSENGDNNDPIDTDVGSTNKLLTYADLFATNAIFPVVTQKNAFVFLDFSNNAIVSLDRHTLIFNTPKPFLDANKNHIYSNGKDNIYK